MIGLIKSALQYLPQTFHPSNILEIAILTVLIYELIKWVKNTRAWTLLRGILVVVFFVFISYALDLTTLKWLISRAGGVLLTIFVIIFQPELRRALEQLGRRNAFFAFFTPNTGLTEDDKRGAERTTNEIVKAVFEMSRARTGALIVLERDVALDEYVRTGIMMDAMISSQLLVNIFEHNTPLHDGAVFIRNQRIVAATCYLPLSDNMVLSKDLGTRHRAGVGISEVSDSLTIIVSEETGAVSLAQDGKLARGITAEELHDCLDQLSSAREDSKLKILRGKIKHAKIADK